MDQSKANRWLEIKAIGPDNRTNSFPSSRRMCTITAAKEKKDEQGLGGWPGSWCVNSGSARGFMAERIILI